jgi:hypothetical protein
VSTVYKPTSVILEEGSIGFIQFSVRNGDRLRGSGWIKDQAMQYIDRSIVNLRMHPTEGRCVSAWHGHYFVWISFIHIHVCVDNAAIASNPR